MGNTLVAQKDFVIDVTELGPSAIPLNDTTLQIFKNLQDLLNVALGNIQRPDLAVDPSGVLSLRDQNAALHVGSQTNAPIQMLDFMRRPTILSLATYAPMIRDVVSRVGMAQLSDMFSAAQRVTRPMYGFGQPGDRVNQAPSGQAAAQGLVGEKGAVQGNLGDANPLFTQAASYEPRYVSTVPQIAVPYAPSRTEAATPNTTTMTAVPLRPGPAIVAQPALPQPILMANPAASQTLDPQPAPRPVATTSPTMPMLDIGVINMQRPGASVTPTSPGGCVDCATPTPQQDDVAITLNPGSPVDGGPRIPMAPASPVDNVNPSTGFGVEPTVPRGVVTFPGNESTGQGANTPPIRVGPSDAFIPTAGALPVVSPQQGGAPAGGLSPRGKKIALGIGASLAALLTIGVVWGAAKAQE